MNSIVRMAGGVGILVVTLFLQFVVSAQKAGIVFFPAVAFYMATVLPPVAAVSVGFIAGMLWDSLSPLPFGAYTISYAGAMFLASYSMRLVDEHKPIARGALSLAVLVVFFLVWGGIYFFLGYPFSALGGYMREMAVSAGILVCIAAGHMIARG
jgi:rod shape-determining protein MreD